MRKSILALSFVLSIGVTAAYAEKYSVAETELGTLLDDPAAAAIIEKHLPGFTTNDQISMARSLTLTSLQSFAADTVTDEALKKIEADLAALPAAK